MIPRQWRGMITSLLILITISNAYGDEHGIHIASKKFTESVILGEILRQVAASTGTPATHRRELGGTRIVWNALLAGQIDAYPEYTGTLLQEILVNEKINDEKHLTQVLADRGVKITSPLGFNNTYAMGVKAKLASELQLKSIADLKNHPQLVFGLGHEFMDRADGWPGLKTRYALPHTHVRGLDHDLAYRAIDTGTIQVMDLYSTDAEIAYYDLVPLIDDQAYFPVYNAVIVYRAELEQRAPAVAQHFEHLADKIDEQTMIEMNARVKIQKEPEAIVAADFLQQNLSIVVTVEEENAGERLWRHTGEHLTLVLISLFAAIVVAIPLGILAAKKPRWGRWIIGTTGILQTIPSLALFVFMIPLLGIGGPPALVALFLYSLLPIVRNTHAGLLDIPHAIRESAEALGLSAQAKLRLIELPLSARAILAGIKTAAVINVGTATLAALIGAGGYGQPILTGIRLDDTALILQGAVPAAVLALLVQGLFELGEKHIIPKGLRIKKKH